MRAFKTFTRKREREGIAVQFAGYRHHDRHDYEDTTISRVPRAQRIRKFPPKRVCIIRKMAITRSITRLPNVNDWNRVICRSIRQINFIYNVLFSPLITNVIDTISI